MLKQKSAITLIALVITIVVLIILAGVLINISLGNNGLFNKAKTAKEMYTNAQDYESTEIAKMTNSIDGHVGGNRGNITLTDEEYAQFKSLIQDKNKNYNYSTEEQVVGTWIDGKPIYQKTYTNLSIVLSNDFVDAFDVSGLNIKKVFNTILNGTYSENVFGIPSATRIKNNKLQIYYYGLSSVTVSDITLQYTKTTD